MKIAYLTGEYPRATDTFIQREVAQLRTQGFEVQTCSIRRTGVEHLVGPEQRAEAANTFYVLAATARPLRSLRAHFGALRRNPGGWWRGLKLALKTSPGGVKAGLYQLFYFAEAVVLADELRAQGVQHLHNHIAKASCTVAMLCREIGGIPYSFTMHGPDIFFEPIRWRLDEKIARASFVACISDFCRSQGMVFSDPSHWDKMHIVHCGVEPARYQPPSDRPGTRALFVGRLAAVKGIPVLFQAMQGLLRDHPDFRLTLIGDGPERQALEAQAQRMGLSDHVDFVGYKSQDEVAQALTQHDLLVLPSFAEGVPVVLMEAMAAELPVVTTQIAGVPELVQNGLSGRLVPPGDAEALRAALDEVLRDPARAAEMGQAGRARVLDQFDIQKEAAWLGTLLRGYIAGTPPTTKRGDA
ncbi:colanic acid biosynthesis glycosyltransferase WcaL [Thalassobius vesicularis]|uniref:Colanic acid biosynthesis glycosyltransferase WcaL n=1 Tax=Thalassobius vesicularis TaxID=1294297 RepID=A0A4S3MD12_9RHOB|nr:glycosyltransferase family 4 protein [Thalassobius vesicularis]THD76731.1 colanic acid biosynthesis glycosyltransferase WcaL [Thalassobius vesicularis]